MMMDINKVSRALHALNMMYQPAFFTLGVASCLKQFKAHKRLSNYFLRKALQTKCKALIEHDRVLNAR